MLTNFNKRIHEFWNSFEQNNDKLLYLLDNEKQQEVIDLIVEWSNSISKNIHVVVGGGKVGKYELIFSPEGNQTKALLFQHIGKLMPKSLEERWVFLHYQQSLDKLKLGYENEFYTFEDFIVYPQLNNRKVDIKVYCEKFKELDKNPKYFLLFTILDLAISELFTMEYIGAIDIVDVKLNEEFITYQDLKSYIEDNIESGNLNKIVLGQPTYFNYQMEPSSEMENYRSDIFAEFYSSGKILNDFYRGLDNEFNIANDFGARYGYIAYDRTNIEDDKVLDIREEITNRILDEGVGIIETIGSATGIFYSYVDFIIFDFESFLSIVSNVFSDYDFKDKVYSDFISLDGEIIKF